MKKYKVGMYGGKFFPFHKGHFHCLQKASDECEKVYCVLIHGGSDEERYFESHDDEYLKPENRKKSVKRICDDLFDNVEFVTLDVSKCRLPNGDEDWDAETPMMLEACGGGDFDAVYGSEPSYKTYFNRAYPKATYILVDVNRAKVPISATMIRNMNEKERTEWMI